MLRKGDQRPDLADCDVQPHVADHRNPVGREQAQHAVDGRRPVADVLLPLLVQLPIHEVILGLHWSRIALIFEWNRI